jgi:hypothetical protein
MFVASLALIAVLVAPAAAAPKKGYTWTVVCGTDAPFTVNAPLGVPGWPDFGTSPILLVGGTFTVTVDGVTETSTNPVPPGLVTRVRACSIDGPLGVDPSVFHIHSEPAFMLLTG